MMSSLFEKMWSAPSDKHYDAIRTDESKSENEIVAAAADNAKRMSMSNYAVAGAAECVSAMSKALQARSDDGELYDAVDDNLLRLVADFVPSRTHHARNATSSLIVV